MKLTNIIATLAVAALTLGGTAFANPISFNELYQKGTKCSEIKNDYVEYDNVTMVDCAATGMEQPMHRFLIGEIDAFNKIVLYLRKRNEYPGNPSDVYDVKGTLQ